MTVETTPPSKRGGMRGLFGKKIYGVPVVYLLAAFVLILAIVAWKMKPSATLQEADAVTATDEETDAASPSGSEAFPAPTNGTVIVSPAQPVVEEAPYEDNDTWTRKAMTFLIKKNVNPGEAQVALQAYLSGDDLTVEQGKIRDMVVREFGLPPETFTVGNTAKPPAVVTPPPTTGTPNPPTTTPPREKPPMLPPPVVVRTERGGVSTPVPVKHVHPQRPAPKPTPPPAKTHVVRPGENLTTIGKRYGKSWQQIHAVNSKTVRNPNLIYPGQRLVIP